uniref:Uncharacterized protein n=1 Tax=Arundo donax TaxID=35708 RepID=A0A0A8YIC7_ARUDO
MADADCEPDMPASEPNSWCHMRCCIPTKWPSVHKNAV